MAKQAAKRAPGADRILDAALDLAARMRWRDVTMEKVAAESGATLERVHRFFPSKAALINGFMDRIDAAVLADHDFADASEPVRERLLDVLMRRFEALRPNKDAVRSILRDAGCDPLSVFCSAPGFARAMAWSLEAAGVNASGPMGLLRIKGLGAIYLSALRVWLNDETEDLSPTMANLDRNLRRADALVSAISRSRLRRRRGGEKAEA